MTTVGRYEVVAHLATPECSLRLIRVSGSSQVEPHYHEKTTQIYVVLEGTAEITIRRRRIRLEPYQTATVAPFTAHGVSSSDTALVLSVSVPPLDPGDQHRVGPPRQP